MTESRSVVITHGGEILTTVQVQQLETEPGEEIVVSEGTGAMVDAGQKQDPLLVFAHASGSNELGEYSKADFSEIFKLVPGDTVTYFEGPEQREFVVTESEPVQGPNILRVPEDANDLNEVWSTVGETVGEEAPSLRLVTVEDQAMTSEADYDGHWVVTAEAAETKQTN